MKTRSIETGMAMLSMAMISTGINAFTCPSSSLLQMSPATRRTLSPGGVIVVVGKRRTCNSVATLGNMNNNSSNNSNNNSSNNSKAIDAEITRQEPEPVSFGKTSGTTSGAASGAASGAGKGLLENIDSFGLELKPLALRANQRSIEFSRLAIASSLEGAANGTPNGTSNGSNNSNNNSITTTTRKQRRKLRLKSLAYGSYSCFLWSLYILYRAYRGFFVILPAVFREVFRQLDESQIVSNAPFEDDDDDDDTTKTDISSGNSSDTSNSTPMRLRTRITISVLSAILTTSYVMTGAVRVLGKFIATLTNTSSVETSLEAAAEEILSNEGKILKVGDDRSKS